MLKDIRYLVFDLDGTLLTRDKHISERTLKAVEAARSKGIRILLDTGRTCDTAGEYLRQLQPDAAVLSYGAHITRGGETVFRRYMSPKTANRVRVLCEQATRIHYQLEDGRVLCNEEYIHSELVDRNAEITKRAEHLCAWNLPRETALEIPKRVRCSLSQLCDSLWCNFSPYGCNKGRGLEIALRELGLPEGAGIGFGDESCDVGFMKVCGFGAAMGNSDEFTLRAADMTIGNNREDGIAVFLEDHIL
ncbi:MAG: HAD family hydrolase [Clostridia bacterium]|nr:HAD family hydrolase [Clostridia bacterium]